MIDNRAPSAPEGRHTTGRVPAVGCASPVWFAALPAGAAFSRAQTRAAADTDIGAAVCAGSTASVLTGTATGTAALAGSSTRSLTGVAAATALAETAASTGATSS